MASQRSKLRETADATVIEQLKEIAVTTQGYVMEDPFPDHEPFESITAKAKSSVQWQSKITAHKKSGSPKPIFRQETPGFVMTVEEQAGPSHSEQQLYKIVGYTFPNMPQTYKTKVASFSSKAMSRDKGVGTWAPEEEHIIQWGYLDEDLESPPVIVVSPVLEVAGNTTQYFALLFPDEDGLCQPHICAQWEIFFRWEFRDATGNSNKRSAQWGALVGKACILSPSASNQRAAGAKMKSTNISGLMVKEEVSLLNELTCLASVLRITPYSSAATELTEVLKKLDGDIIYNPLPSNPGMHAFLHDEFTDERAVQLVQEVTTCYEKIPNLTPKIAIELRGCLEALVQTVAEGVEVDIRYENLFWLFTEGTHKLTNFTGDLATANKAAIAQEIIDTVTRLRPRAFKTPAVISNDEETALVSFLDAYHQDSEELIKKWDRQMERLKQTFGSKVTKDIGAWDFWARYGDARDTASAQLAFQEVGRYTVGQVKEFMDEDVFNHMKKRQQLLGHVLAEVKKAKK